MPSRNVVLSNPSAPGSAATTAFLAGLLRRYLKALKLSGVEVSLSVVTDAEIREINRAWRKKDKPTDVLSFPAGEAPLPPGQPRPLGDLIISLETAKARATEDRRPLRAELARYLAHGLLHLLGHDHHRPDEAKRMARAERALLGGVGMVEAALLDRPARRRTRSAAPKKGARRG